MKARIHIPWIYKLHSFEEIPEGAVSFVYVITDTVTGIGYIGKKSFWSTSCQIQPNGRKKNTTVESDWRKYYSSNNTILSLVKGGNGSRFRREILHICKTKGTATYLEAKEQFLRGVLEEPDKWYNQQIECRIHVGHLKL